MESLRGHLLIASPHLPDPNFKQSVVLLIEHSADGALGLVLNQMAATTLKELWCQVDESPCECEQTVRLGGPVQGPVMSLHGRRELSESEIVPGVYVAAQIENMQRLVRENMPPFRVFLGYAGWGAGQLETELKAGGWLTSLASKDIVFAEDVDNLWRDAVHQTGQRILRDALDIRAFPDDPSVN